MGFLYTYWSPNITANVIAQRISKRKKSVGGAFDTIGFSTPNDMGTGVSDNIATVDNNKVYEFKVENICVTGGPTINDTGIKEQIVFACILPVLTSDGTTVNVNIPLLSTDIDAVAYTLYKQVDSSTVATALVARTLDNAPYSFTGLTPSTGYYISVILVATVGGTEADSSNVAYLNSLCGGNVTGYQISTTSAVSTCRMYQNITSFPVPSVGYVDCDGNSHVITVNPGQSICVDTSFGIPSGLVRVSNMCV